MKILIRHKSLIIIRFNTSVTTYKFCHYKFWFKEKNLIFSMFLVVLYDSEFKIRIRSKLLRNRMAFYDAL